MVRHSWIVGGQVIAVIYMLSHSTVLQRVLAQEARNGVNVVETVSFEPGGRICVPVIMRETKLLFYLNIAIGDTLVDVSQRDLFASKVRDSNRSDASKLGKDITAPQPTILVGENRREAFELTSPVRFEDLSSGEMQRERHDVGALAMDYLRTKVLQIDFDNRVARVRQTPDFTDGAKEQLQFLHGVPAMFLHHPKEGNVLCRMVLADKNILLESSVYNRLRKKGRIKDLPAIDPKGEVVTYHGILDFIEVGPFRFSNQYVEMNDVSAVGQQFLSRFNIEFNFPRKTATLKPSREFEHASSYNRAGFMIRATKDQRFPVVFDVSGPANNSGLLDTDELFEINGRRSQEITTPQLYKLLSIPGNNIELTVKRESQLKKLSFKLSEDAPPFPKLPPNIEQSSDSDFDERK